MQKEQNSKSKILLVGASGLIGSELLKLTLEDHEVTEVHILVRKLLDINHEKLVQYVVDFQDLSKNADYFLGVQTVFCTIGTTRKKTPNLEEYRQIDYGIPTQLMQLAAENQVPKFMLVSSVGADSKSSNFYLKIKGEVEDVFNQYQFEKRGIFQPSLLLGNRKEARLGEALARRFMPILNFLIPKKYKAIHAGVVAEAMLKSSKIQEEATKVYTYAEMNAILRH